MPPGIINVPDQRKIVMAFDYIFKLHERDICVECGLEKSHTVECELHRVWTVVEAGMRRK